MKSFLFSKEGSLISKLIIQLGKLKKEINLRKDEISFSWNQGNLKLCSIFVISIKKSDISGSIPINKFKKHNGEK